MIPASPLRRYDAVLCDVDGCLIHEGGDPFDLVHMRLIADYNREAMRAGDRPVVTLCTGRPVAFADCMAKLIGNVHLPLVAENGVWLYHAGNNEWRMDPDITHEHLVAVRELGDYIQDRWAADGVSVQPGKTASVSPYHADPAFLPRIEPEIRAYCEAHGHPFRISATWHYINCDLRHVSKASGIRRWEAWTGIPKTRRAGIGDTAGDLAIAASVAAFGAPANRDPLIDPQVTHPSAAPGIEGVLDILAQWVGARVEG
jgi:hydroxymethylpyrimidine pyrophosphatase-like HAD family hydrolase